MARSINSTQLPVHKNKTIEEIEHTGLQRKTSQFPDGSLPTALREVAPIIVGEDDVGAAQLLLEQRDHLLLAIANARHPSRLVGGVAVPAMPAAPDTLCNIYGDICALQQGSGEAC